MSFSYRLSLTRMIAFLQLFFLAAAGCSKSDPLSDFKAKTQGRQVPQQLEFFCIQWTWKELYNEGRPHYATMLCGDVYECDDPVWKGRRLVRLTVSVDESNFRKELSQMELQREDGTWVLDGRQEEFFKDGEHRIGSYKMDVLNGIQTAWYPNGQMHIREFYKDGKQTGLCEGWRPNGTRSFESQYENGVEVWGVSYDENGKPVK